MGLDCNCTFPPKTDTALKPEISEHGSVLCKKDAGSTLFIPISAIKFSLDRLGEDSWGSLCHCGTSSIISAPKVPAHSSMQDTRNQCSQYLWMTLQTDLLETRLSELNTESVRRSGVKIIA